MSMPEFNDGDKVRVMNNNVTEELGCSGIVGRITMNTIYQGVKCFYVEASDGKLHRVPMAHLIKVD